MKRKFIFIGSVLPIHKWLVLIISMSNKARAFFPFNELPDDDEASNMPLMPTLTDIFVWPHLLRAAKNPLVESKTLYRLL